MRQITSRSEIKQILADAKAKIFFFQIRMGDEVVRATLNLHDEHYDQLKLTCERAWMGVLGSVHQAEFHLRDHYYHFELTVQRAMGSSIYTSMPKMLAEHPARHAKRLRVHGKKVPVRLTFLGSARYVAPPNPAEIRKPDLALIWQELQKDMPDVNAMAVTTQKFLASIGDKVEVKLGSRQEIPDLILPVFDLRQSFVIQDASSFQTAVQRDSSLVGVMQWADLPQKVRESPEASENGTWWKDLQARKVRAELWVPIHVVSGVIGYICATLSAQREKGFRLSDILAAAALGETLGEAAIKRNLNHKTGGGQSLGLVQVHDLSEGGMRFEVHDPILLKILRVASEVRIEMEFFGKAILLPARVVRVRTKEAGAEHGVFSVEFHTQEILTQDRAYFRRVLSFYDKD